MSERIDWRDIEQSANGRWFEILESFGIETRKLNRNGPCPTCGGNDRAHFFERDGRILLYCRGGCGNSGGGNCVSTPEHLLQEHNRWSFPEMVRQIAEYLGKMPIAPVVHTARKAQQSTTYPASHVENRERAAEHLDQAVPVETHIELLRENTAAIGALSLNGRLIVPLLNGSDELVNVAALVNGNVYYCAKGISFGATARIPARINDSGRVILCCDYFAAWRLWWAMKGAAEVRAAISPDNFLFMSRKMKGSFTDIAVYEQDLDEYRELGFSCIPLRHAY